ncbi:MAG: SusC/RagA family TonB-linked outer membrane protein [Phaeodactylibacter sp.]|nr:SusC/RagA family TonB-linked outer membrane protein [Phaeodactylibacter sp.]
MKKLLMVLPMVLLAFTLAVAQRTITGTVTDDQGTPLIGASVLVKGTTSGTVTDVEGAYSLNVPKDRNTLVYSYTGYSTLEVELGASNVLDVTLQEGVTLETAVVTALGVERQEKAIGYAVQEVGGGELEETNAVSFIDALSGKAAGVQVTQASGAAGAASRVVLRGQTSFNGNNEALIVVDGVRLDNSENHTERSLGGVANSNRGMDLNPNDIESVTVLKGAAASALYGVEGARGVVLITTKKGASGKGIKIDFTTRYTLSEVNKLPEFQDQYVQGISGEWLGPETGWPLSFGPRADTLFWDGSDYQYDKNGRIVGQSDPSAQTPFKAYDNAGDLYQTGRMWTNNLSFSGGNDVSNYRFSFGRTDQTGIVPKNTYERTNVGLAAGARLLDNKLDISGSVNYVKTAGRRIQQGSNTSGLNLGLFRTPISFDNSNGTSDPADSPEAYVFPNNRQRNFRGGGGYDNPYWLINLNPFFDNVNRMYGSFRAAYTVDQWLTFSGTFGTDFYTDNRTQEFEVGSRNVPAGQVIEDQWNYFHTDIYLNVLGNGNLTDDLTLSYNLGTNLWNKRNKNNYIQGDGLNFFGYRELSNAQSISSLIDNFNERNFSLFGSLDLGYRSFLYVTLTGRNDWLSTLVAPSKAFNAGDISVFYPSASLSLVFSELIDSRALSFGKARVSYGQVGGGAPAAYLTDTYYTVPNTTGTINSLNDGWTNGILFPYKGIGGFTYNALQGNANLTPSTTTDIEFGLDLRFLNNKLRLDASYYTRESKDQIIPINVANTTGFQRSVFNSGLLNTKGGEVILGITPVKTPDFSWDLNFNFSKWKTTVEALPEGVPNQYLDGFTGTSIYNIAPDKENGIVYEYGQLYGGAFQHANTPDGRSFDASLPYNPNGALIIDDSGSPDPNADDYNTNYGYPLVDPNQRVIGNPNPDFLLGINNTLHFKGLSLSFLFDIKQGGDIWNGTKGAMVYFGTSKLTEDRDPLNADGYSDYANATNVFEGIKASDGSANDIRTPLDENWYTGNGGGFGAVAEHFIEDGSFARLRYASLSYNFGDMINGLSDLTVTFTGRNLVLITDYTGVDPETSLVGSSSNGQGLEYFQMPGTRSYALGLNVKF